MPTRASPPPPPPFSRYFIGQSGGGKGTKAGGGGICGMKQADQKSVLSEFREGAFNVLVATCIGEEGLDIPAVDLIVCCDSSASPTRNIQVRTESRSGRMSAKHRSVVPAD